MATGLLAVWLFDEPFDFAKVLALLSTSVAIGVYSLGNLRATRKLNMEVGNQPLLGGVSETAEAEASTVAGSGLLATWDLRSSVFYSESSSDGQPSGQMNSVSSALSLASVARATLSAELGELRSQQDIDAENDYDAAYSSLLGDGMPSLHGSTSTGTAGVATTSGSDKLAGVASALPPA